MGDFLRDRLPDPAEFFASEGVALSGKGIWRTAPCNFHGSRDSLRINTSSGAFVCMAACGLRGGDVLADRMAAHGEDFQTAAKALGAWQESTTPNRCRRAMP